MSKVMSNVTGVELNTFDVGWQATSVVAFDITFDIFCTNGVMIGVYAPMISEKPSRDTPAYKADKNAFAGFTLKINAMIKMINGTTIADPKLSMIAFKNSNTTISSSLCSEEHTHIILF